MNEELQKEIKMLMIKHDVKNFSVTTSVKGKIQHVQNFENGFEMIGSLEHAKTLITNMIANNGPRIPKKPTLVK